MKRFFTPFLTVYGAVALVSVIERTGLVFRLRIEPPSPRGPLRGCQDAKKRGGKEGEWARGRVGERVKDLTQRRKDAKIKHRGLWVELERSLPRRHGGHREEKTERGDVVVSVIERNTTRALLDAVIGEREESG